MIDHKKYPALIGAIAGDTIGSIYEFNNTKRTDFELLQPGMNYTDDSLMTLTVADWLLKRTPSDDDAQLLIDIMRRCARQYPCPMGGYGGRFFKWLISPSPKPYNSWGNGSAMRVSGVGYAATRWRKPCGWPKSQPPSPTTTPKASKGHRPPLPPSLWRVQAAAKRTSATT